MKNFFKPEDFGHEGLYDTDSRASGIANKKLNALIESAPLVYSYNGEDDWFVPTTQNYPNVTHKARLILIEEIKKECVNHVTDSTVVYLQHSKTIQSRCVNCGKQIVAEWKEVKP